MNLVLKNLIKCSMYQKKNIIQYNKLSIMYDEENNMDFIILMMKRNSIRLNIIIQYKNSTIYVTISHSIISI